MANEKQTNQAVVENAVQPEEYEKRLEKMSDKQLRAEARRQSRSEYRNFHMHGVALATVLEAIMDGHINGRAPYLR